MDVNTLLLSAKTSNRIIKTCKNVRYFIKLSVEYCRIFVINCIFAAVMTFY